MRVRAADGVLLDAAPVQRTNVGYDVSAAVAAFNNQWIVAWSHGVTHDAPYASIRYMIVDAGGNGSVTDTGGAGTFSNGEAALATDGVQALLVWTSGGDVFGRRILYDGSKLDTDAGFLISGANSQQFAPGVGWNGSVFEVAWTDFRAHVNVLETGIGDVYAARVDANGVVLDPNGTVVANDFLTPEGRASVAGGASASVVAFEALRTSAPFGNWRVAVTAKLPSTGTAFCSGDGSGTACPCGNVGDAGSGCGNSVNASGARLSGAGMASVSNDQFVLSGTGMPNSSALYFQGTTQSGGGLGVVFGDGLRCAGGSITRLGAKLNAGGVSQFPSGADPAISVKAMNTAGDVRTYQVWYRNAAPFCSASTFNLTNGLQVTWSP
jgi:hypothetical protein